MTEKERAEEWMKRKCVSLDGPARQFAGVDRVGKGQRAHDANWEARHLGDVG